MPLCVILEDYGRAEGGYVGDVVDITNPWKLIEEGKVKLYVKPKPVKKVKKKAVSSDSDSEAGGADAGPEEPEKADE